MPNCDRPPSFPFYPRDFLTDSAVADMSPEERGGYISLLCHAWLRDEAGVLPSDDPTLARLSGLGDRWPACRDSISRAFKLSSGSWMQKRMMQEREAQKQRRRKAAKGAVVTNVRRWGSVASDAPSDRLSVSPAFALASAFESKEEPTHFRSEAARPSPNGIIGFTEFWNTHPKKRSKGQALKAWKALHADEPLRSAIMAGLGRAILSEDWLREDGRFIPYPATWLRARGWEDEIAVRDPRKEAGW